MDIIKYWIPLIVSSIALLISALPYIQQPEIHGRIIGLMRSGQMTYPFTDKDGISNNITGVGYTVNVLITVLNKNFDIKDLKMYVKYSDDNQKHQGKIISANEGIFDFNGIKRKLLIPTAEELIYTNVLEKGKANSYFIRFIVDQSLEKPEKIRPLEEIEISFYDFKDKQIKLSLKYKDVSVERMLSFDAKYWKEVK